MSITVRGTLVVDRKQGKRGAFNVGDLATEIGEFEVKDALIEEFEPGRYTGTFAITWIEPDSFAWRGKVFVKNRVTLEAIFVDDIDDQDHLPPAPPPEPDPAEGAGAAQSTTDQTACATPPQPAKAGKARTSGQDSDQRDHPQAVGLAGDADEALFGAEIHALLVEHQPIKLDPTVDRLQFRSQRDRLKDLGYGFDAKLQTWSLKH